MGNTSVFINISTPGVISGRVITSVGGSTVLFTVTGPMPRVVPSLTGRTNTGIIKAKHSSFPGRMGGIITFPNVFGNTLRKHTARVARRVGLTTTGTVTNLISRRRLGRGGVLPRTFSPHMTSAMDGTVGSLVWCIKERTLPLS